MASEISRLYDFQPGSRAASGQVDDEFNQLVTAYNTLNGEVIALIALLDSATGATTIGATPVPDLNGSTVQALIESIRNKLKSITDGDSGADFIGSTPLKAGGSSTVQGQLKELYVEESLRVQNENIRKSNETARITAENIRKSNETARITAEDVRQDNEEARQEADILRGQTVEAIEAHYAPRLTSVEEQINDLASKTVVTLNHQFADTTARDAYFVINPTELVDKLFIKVGTGYQQYIDNVWKDVNAVIAEVYDQIDDSQTANIKTYSSEKIEQLRQQDKLKVAQIDKELNDFKQTLSQVNINQEAKQSVTDYGVVSLPKNAANGQVSAVVIKGVTGIPNKSWAEIQSMVRSGKHLEFFTVGDQFIANYNGSPVVWDIIGIDHDKPTDTNYTHSLTIQAHDCIINCQFDAPEPTNTDANRRKYGNNRYIHSAIRQWLNSNDAVFNWVSQHEFDAPPTAAPYTGAGFLKLLDPELVAVLGAVDKQVARNTVDGGGQDLFSDKVFLLSRKEIYGTDEGTVTGEKTYAFYSAMAGAATDEALAGRIKYSAGSARVWWLRSPNVGYSHYSRLVGTPGNVYSYHAIDALSLAPACCIV